MKDSKDTFSFFYKKYYAYVFKMILMKIRSVEDAEDITQEIFITLLRNIHSINSVKKWLHAAVNYASGAFFKEQNIQTKLNSNQQQSMTIELPQNVDTLLLKEALNKAKCNELELNMLRLVGMHNTKKTDTAEKLGITRRQVNYRYEQLKNKIVYHFKSMGITGINDLVS